jgi:SAM-dependent methyltransferase
MFTPSSELQRLAQTRDQAIARNWYYYHEIFRHYRYLIPPNQKVLEIGCGTGQLLNAVNPSRGMGIDTNAFMIEKAKEKYPHLHFVPGDVGSIKHEETFDYIILSGLIGDMEDIQQFLTDMRRFCTKNTRVIIEYYSYLWQYLLKGTEKLKLKTLHPFQNWLTAGDISNFLTLSGYEAITVQRKILLPVGIPLVSLICNRLLANLPLFNALTATHFMIARPLFTDNDDHMTSIVIPCRNEKGNIEPAIARTPIFGKSQEFIFVEGGSQDGTYEEILRVAEKYKNRNIQVYRQTGKGKGDAVRLGFDKAQGDILMILDADLTVPPEDLPKFYRVFKDNKGEFINGCRLVYPMEKQAMRFLNLIANKFFGVFFSWLLGQPFKDTLCGTKVLSKIHYTQIARNRSYFGDFDPFGDFDLIFGATKLNLKIIDLPIRYRDRQYGTTQIRRFYHGMLLFRMCFFAMRKIKFH